MVAVRMGWTGSPVRSSDGVMFPTVQPRHWREHVPIGTDLRVEDLTARRSLPAAWAEVWGANPSAPLIYDVGAGTEARWVTAGEFEERTRLAATRLMGLGLHKGDRVLLCVGSSLAAAKPRDSFLPVDRCLAPVALGPPEESTALLFDHGYAAGLNIRAYTSKTRDAERAKRGLAPLRGRQ